MKGEEFRCLLKREEASEGIAGDVGCFRSELLKSKTPAGRVQPAACFTCCNDRAQTSLRTTDGRFSSEQAGMEDWESV